MTNIIKILSRLPQYIDDITPTNIPLHRDKYSRRHHGYIIQWLNMNNNDISISIIGNHSHRGKKYHQSTIINIRNQVTKEHWSYVLHHWARHTPKNNTTIYHEQLRTACAPFTNIHHIDNTEILYALESYHRIQDINSTHTRNHVWRTRHQHLPLITQQHLITMAWAHDIHAQKHQDTALNKKIHALYPMGYIQHTYRPTDSISAHEHIKQLRQYEQIIRSTP